MGIVINISLTVIAIILLFYLVTIGPLRANLVTVEFHLEPGSPSEVDRDTQSPTEAAAAVDGADQSDLNFTRHTSDSEPGTKCSRY